MTPAGRGASHGRPRRDARRGAAGGRYGASDGRSRASDRRSGVPDGHPHARPAARDGLGGDQVEGRRAVRELLAAGRRPIRTLWLAEGLDPSPQLDEIEQLAARRRVRVEMVSRARLEAAARTEAPQGVLARARPIEPVDLDDLAAPARGPAFIVVVAGVTDPRNLGALLRSAECAGVTGVVLPRHRAVHLSPTVAKVAAGAIEHLDFALVGGIPNALEHLSSLGIWALGLASESPRSIYDVAIGDGPMAVVVGGEERGLAPLVRRRCDEVVAIPQHGSLASLNVGVAAAVACFEVARRRSS
ncbi:MAG: 23S rRNA (guanosine(2251)-2'-O)-methyltransferase RlmB [Actinomycetota bacterium]|nr:23S rRNA (guanosine(2251)-2'-O)-methyltransferase RlmB [Actinomycetota bacterium]